MEKIDKETIKTFTKLINYYEEECENALKLRNDKNKQNEYYRNISRIYSGVVNVCANLQDVITAHTFRNMLNVELEENETEERDLLNIVISSSTYLGSVCRKYLINSEKIVKATKVV